SLAVVIPDHVNATGVIGGDASGEIEAEQRIARSVRQATITPPDIAVRRSSLKRRKPVVRKRARLEALRRLIVSVICWRCDARDGLRRARFGRNAINGNNENRNQTQNGRKSFQRMHNFSFSACEGRFSYGNCLRY